MKIVLNAVLTEFILLSQVNQRRMLQSESLTGLQQVVEERSVQLFNQEERIHQRDDLMTKVITTSTPRSYCNLLKTFPE